ncbi:hypothetical protein U5640_22775 [Streptomyces sp. SS7]|uniref:hypothetical protein n=1 Tax=Streptomyces sp. SS7 TaxID=3108485 RepID=UPI0030EEBE0A
MTEPTRLLCAAAHLRPDGAEEFAENIRKWRRKQAKQIRHKLTPEKVRLRRLEKAAREALAGEKATLEKLVADDTATAPKQPRVVVGHEYVRWIRHRVLSDGRPTPSYGFDLEAVLTACEQAQRLLWLRRTLTALACVAGGLCALTPLGYLAPVVALTGMWAAFWTDRILAQRRLRTVIRANKGEAWGAEVPRRFQGAVERIRDASYGEVVPYRNQMRGSGTRYHFVGAGKVWFETQIGIDVMPARSRNDGAGDIADSGSLQIPPSVVDLLTGAHAGDGVVEFTPDDLHAHVARELQRPIAPLRDFHPDSAQEVFGVAAISAERWARPWPPSSPVGLPDRAGSRVDGGGHGPAPPTPEQAHWKRKPSVSARGGAGRWREHLPRGCGGGGGDATR